jgi:hypothetical protein
MIKFEPGTNPGDEQKYQTWLEAHPEGWVFTDRNSTFTLHRARCDTHRFPQEGTGFKGRSGRVCFEGREEATNWANSDPGMKAKGWDTCGRCRA